MKQTNINAVRRAVVKHMGSRVKVKTNRGRHRIDITEGIISETYPSIFVIKLDDSVEDAVKTMSFSYTDIITQDVQLSLCES